MEGQHVEYEYVLFDEQGHPGKYLLISYHPHFNSNGEIKGVISTSKDITQIKSDKLKIKKQNEELAA